MADELREQIARLIGLNNWQADQVIRLMEWARREGDMMIPPDEWQP